MIESKSVRLNSPHLPLSPSPPMGRRGDVAGTGGFSLTAPNGQRTVADGDALLSLSAPGGGEGRGEVGVEAAR